MAVIVLYGLSLMKAGAQNGSGSYDYIVSTIQMLNQSAIGDYEELTKIARETPHRLADVGWLQEKSREMNMSGGYLIVRLGDEIICNGASDENDIDVERLPDFGDNEQAKQAAVFLEGNNPALIRQIDFVLEDGTKGTLFLVSTSKSILPEVKRVLGISLCRLF